MCTRLEQQLRIEQVPIHDLEINLKSRDSYVHLIRPLKEVFTTPEYSAKIFSILEDKNLSGKKATGRPEMDLWQIFVLSQVRPGLNIGYDWLHTMANNDRMLRMLMGIETEIGFEKKNFEYQHILDNISLLDHETVGEINELIVELGHGVLKKKRRKHCA